MINIERSPKPDFDFQYDDKRIETIIRDDFFILCYLCEEYVPVHFQIDHFYPQVKYPHLKNDWNNLFYSCQKCNSMRYKNINTDNQTEVLNCCEEDVENLIELRFLKDKNRVQIIDNGKTEITKNTIKLLNKIYNGIGTTSNSPMYRKTEIKNEIEKFEEVLQKNKKSKGLHKHIIRKKLSKKNKEESNYVSFKRQVIKDNKEEYEEFLKYFD